MCIILYHLDCLGSMNSFTSEVQIVKFRIILCIVWENSGIITDSLEHIGVKVGRPPDLYWSKQAEHLLRASWYSWSNFELELMCDENVGNDLKVWFNFLHWTVSIEIQTKQVPRPNIKQPSFILLILIVGALAKAKSEDPCASPNQVGRQTSNMKTWRQHDFHTAKRFRIFSTGAQGEAAISGKALGEMLQRLHQVWGCREGYHSTLLSTLSYFLVKTYHRINIKVCQPASKNIVHCFCVSRMGEYCQKESRMSWIWVE